MKVRIVRSGGLAGVAAAGERDFAELSQAQQTALEKLQSTSMPSVPSPGADRFRYKVSIIDNGKTRDFDVAEDAMPDELASIVRIGP